MNNSDGPVTIANNTSATLSWTSTNATSCSAAGGPWSGNKATSNSEATGNLTSTQTYTLSCTGSGGTSQDSVIVVVSAAIDTQAPTVSITSPTGGQSVSGAINITTSSSDNLGVTKVEFYVDNVLKNTDSNAPFTYSLNTTTLTNAGHSVSAKAFDAASNSTSSSSVTFIVANTVTNLPVTKKVGDLNGDGKVDIFDLSLLLSKWGGMDSNADINNDSIVNIYDLSVLLSKWGS